MCDEPGKKFCDCDEQLNETTDPGHRGENSNYKVGVIWKKTGIRLLILSIYNIGL